MERFLKQAIVDKDPYVATAGLVAGSHLAQHSMDIVKRWTSEVLIEFVAIILPTSFLIFLDSRVYEFPIHHGPIPRFGLIISNQIKR